MNFNKRTLEKENLILQEEDKSQRLYEISRYINKKENILLQLHIDFKTIASFDINEYGSMIVENYEKFSAQRQDNYFFIIPTMEFKPTESKIIVSHPCFGTSLQQRLFDFPSSIDEKLSWASQLIYSVSLIHSLGLFHGEIFPSKIYLTNFDQIHLLTMGFIVPQFFAIDDYASFDLFYPQDEEKCFIAPERFCARKTLYCNLEDINILFSLQQADVFNLGCVLFFIFTEGESLFDFYLLQQSRKDKQFEKNIMSKKLKRIEDLKIRAIIEEMIKLNPNERLKSYEFLLKWNSTFISKNPQLYFIERILICKTLLPDYKALIICFFLFMTDDAKSFSKKFFLAITLEKVKTLIEEVLDSQDIVGVYNLLSIFDKESHLEEENNEKSVFSYKRGQKIFFEIKDKILMVFVKFVEVLILRLKNPSLCDLVTSQISSSILNKKFILTHTQERVKLIQKASTKLSTKKKEEVDWKISINLKNLLHLLQRCHTTEVPLITQKFIENFCNKDSFVFILVSLQDTLEEAINNKFYRLSSLQILATIISLFKKFQYVLPSCPIRVLHKICFRLFSIVLNAPSNITLKIYLINSIKTLLKFCFTSIIPEYTEGKKEVFPEKVLNNASFYIEVCKLSCKFSSCILKCLDEFRLSRDLLTVLPKIIPFLFNDENLLAIQCKIFSANYRHLQLIALKCLPYLIVRQSMSVQLSCYKIICPESLDELKAFVRSVEMTVFLSEKNLLLLSKTLFYHMLIQLKGSYFPDLREFLKTIFEELSWKIGEGSKWLFDILENMLDEIPVMSLDTKRERSLSLPLNLSKSKTSLTEISSSSLEVSAFSELEINTMLKKFAEFLLTSGSDETFECLQLSLKFSNDMLIEDILLRKILSLTKARNSISNYGNQLAELAIEAGLSLVKVNSFAQQILISSNASHTADVEESLFPQGNFLEVFIKKDEKITSLGQVSKNNLCAGTKSGKIICYTLDKLSEENNTCFNIEGKVISFTQGDFNNNFIAASSQQVSLYDLEKGEVRTWKEKDNVLSTLIKLENEASSVCTFSSGKVCLVDVRSPELIFLNKLTSNAGTVTACTKIKQGSNLLLGTQKGYVALFDLRMSMFFCSYQLRRKKSFQSINALHTFFLEPNKESIVVSYQSEKSEFSIFSLNENDLILPFAHFSREQKGENEAIKTVPFLENVTKKLPLSLDSGFERYEISWDISQKSGYEHKFSELILSWQTNSKTENELNINYDSSEPYQCISPQKSSSINSFVSFQNKKFNNLFCAGTDSIIRSFYFQRPIQPNDQKKDGTHLIELKSLPNTHRFIRNFDHYHSGPNLTIIEEYQSFEASFSKKLVKSSNSFSDRKTEERLSKEEILRQAQNNIKGGNGHELSINCLVALQGNIMTENQSILSHGNICVTAGDDGKIIFWK